MIRRDEEKRGVVGMGGGGGVTQITGQEQY